MLVPERRRRVLAHVQRHGSAQVGRLAAELGVSTWTVRRDLAELEHDGRVIRTHGGAVVRPPEAGRPPAPADEQAAKDAIAATAAELIADDTTVMLLGGSTTQALVPYLTHRRLTVVTNGLEIAAGLKDAEQVTLVLLGGYLHREQMTLLGPMTESSMGDLHVDVMVGGAWGIDPRAGITGAKIVQAGYHHRMLDRTQRLVVLADHTKFGRVGPTVLAALDQVDTVVTDSVTPRQTVADVRSAGPEVVRAPA